MIEINISDLSYDSYAEYLIESVSTDRIIEFNNSKGSGSIIRNAGPKERSTMVGYDNDVGFIVHIPTKNVYFFNRDLLYHAAAGFRIGLDVDGDVVYESICGYYDGVSPSAKLDSRNMSRIRLSNISSDDNLIKPETFDAILLAFEKALMRPAITDIGIFRKGDAAGIFRSRNKRAFLSTPEM
jgi:hypothetical protein